MYASALLFARAFGQKDVRPSAVFMSVLALAFVLSEYIFGSEVMNGIITAVSRYGVLLPILPLGSALFAEGIKAVLDKRSTRKVTA